MKNSFWDFIEGKPLYYKEIDHKRVQKAYHLLKPYIRQPLTIHVVGTNGKGSTGRILASLLHASTKNVGHFSSPHILKFNERIWINGSDISNFDLEIAHEKLYGILGQDMSNALSYFEYTTLLSFVAMEMLDVIVLEAGLGGEYDATNVCSKALSIITPIGLDHQAFLGENIEKIAITKMNSIDNKFVLALQVHKEVYDVSEQIIEKKKAECYKVEIFKEKYKKEYDKVNQLAKELEWSEYFFENALSALLALKILRLTYNIEDLRNIKFFGRFYKFLPNVTIDVGHNLLAVQAIIKTLKSNIKKEKPILVYNTLDDKDYVSILKEFKPYIMSVEVLGIKTPRALEKNLLENTLKFLNIQYKDYENIDENSEYLVFGSFYVVESFLSKNK